MPQDYEGLDNWILKDGHKIDLEKWTSDPRLGTLSFNLKSLGKELRQCLSICH